MENQLLNSHDSFDMKKDFISPNLPSRCSWSQGKLREDSPHSFWPVNDNLKVLPNILKAIGSTPLIKLNQIPKDEGIKCQMYAKCEFLNPGGSVKDRIGYRMVEDYEKKGIIKPGYTLIEPTSGNTGIGIAMASAVKGYRCIIVMPEKMSNEKVSVLKTLGAEIIRTPTAAAFNTPESLIAVAQKLKKSIPNSFILDQYRNEGNPLAHYDGTGAEIIKQLNGKVDYIVAGAGTGGTLCGIGRYLKDNLPSCKLIGVDPYGSILAEPSELNKSDIEFYEVEGIGYDFIPTVFDRSTVTKWIKTEDKNSLLMSRRLIKQEGLLCGASSGSAMWAACQVAKDLNENQTLVVVLPDSIRNYLTKFVSDSWMAAKNFVKEDKPEHWWWNKTISTMNLVKPQEILETLTCKEAIELIEEKQLDNLIILDSQGNFKGILTQNILLSKLIENKCKLNGLVKEAAYHQLSKVDNHATLGQIARILERENCVFVVKKNGNEEKVIGKLTKVDLLKFIQSK